MHYVIGDIHNDNRRFFEMLKKIGFSEEDHLFDRNSYEPDPIGVYYMCNERGIQAERNVIAILS